MLQHVVSSGVLDGLHHRGVCFVGCQGLYHRSWPDLWHFDLVAVLLYLGNKSNTYMGFGEEAATYLGGIQHHMDLDILHGLGTAPTSLIRLLR